MKTLVNIFVIVLITQGVVFAQGTGPARIHFFNAIVGQTVGLQTNQQTKPILVKSRIWLILETRSDSLPLIINNKPYSLYFERGKSYYFVIQTGPGSHNVVTEKSEREFILTATTNSTRGPEIYQIETAQR